MKLLRFVALFCIVACHSTPDNHKVQTNDLCNFVNPFVGTGGHGHTYPGSTVPFGMLQLSPDTRLTGWDGCSGYHFSDSVIYGFSHTHLSGTGVSDYGDLLLLPHGRALTDSLDYTTYSSAFQKANEKASPGYYAVKLDAHDIQAELTSSSRCGMHRYTFPASEQQRIMLDLQHRDQLLDASIEVLDAYTVQGKRISNAWATEQHFYYYLRFSKPILEHQLLQNDSSDAVHAQFLFENSPDELLVKVGISAVSEAGAQKNLQTEMPDFEFDKYVQKARNKWNEELGKVKIEGSNKEQKTIFYTALYHSFIVPNLFNDVDGQYRGTDLKVHAQTEFDYYTIFSLWDTFRGTHPLFAILQRKRSLDFIKTMLQQYKDGGQLPVWELAANYTGCMIGYHAVSAITDAYVKGIDSFDLSLALEAMQHSANQDHLGLSFYKKNGFIACDEEAESVSKTLEYAYDDWCIAQLAKACKKDSIYKVYLKRAQSYKNLYDPGSNFLRGRIHGGWFGPFDPSEVNFNYTEANGWQYTFFAPQDIQGLIKLMGGNKKFEAMLDRMFESEEHLEGRHQVDITGLIGQYAQGNEPSHHVAYLYNYIQKPWKTQQRVRQIMDDLYFNKPDGLSGNEDCGQMSSWYNLSALGIYSVTPGSPYYAIGSPIFNKAHLQLENGATFSIVANNVSKTNKYIQSVELNGVKYNKSYIHHDDIMQGGRIVFEMGNVPNKKWAIASQSVPPSSIRENSIIPSPVIVGRGKTFLDSMSIKLQCSLQDANLYYTTDGTLPDENSLLYTDSLLLDSTCQIHVIAIKEGQKSTIIRNKFLKIDDSKKIRILSEYANQYAAGGDRALIDQLEGGLNFRTGYWQGYQQDMEFVVDLGKVQEVRKLSLGLLQDIRSWIFYPKEVVFNYSVDSSSFDTFGNVVSNLPDNDYEPSKNSFSIELQQSVQARYIQVRAKNYGVCPPWHLGNGGKTWIFADEFIVQ